jgi:putative transposase
MELITHYPHFFTATILEWKKLLKPDKYKDIIISSLQYLVEQQRVKVFGFVIMTNHIHVIWQSLGEYTPVENQHSFMKFTAQMIIKDLRNNHPQVLEHFKVDLKDRKHQIWERNPLSVEIWTKEVMEQKLAYIHQNLVKAELCTFPEDYNSMSFS